MSKCLVIDFFTVPISTKISLPNANPIPGYPGYPPPRAGLVTQGFHDPNCQLPFIATLDLPDFELALVEIEVTSPLLRCFSFQAPDFFG